MQFRKIAGPTRIDSGSAGEQRTYRLKGTPGGRMVASLQYMVKVLQSADTDTEVGVDVDHGPDGEIYRILKSNIIPYESAGPAPVLLVGGIGKLDSNAEIIGEWILPILKIQKSSGGSGAKWAVVEFYEMRKPF